MFTIILDFSEQTTSKRHYINGDATFDAEIILSKRCMIAEEEIIKNLCVIEEKQTKKKK